MNLGRKHNKHSESQNIIIKVPLPPTVYLTEKCNTPPQNR